MFWATLHHPEYLAVEKRESLDGKGNDRKYLSLKMGTHPEAQKAIMVTVFLSRVEAEAIIAQLREVASHAD